MESPPTAQPIFAGEFRHAMDAKNRVTIPSRWRRGEVEEFFAIPNLKGGFMMVMPPAEFTRLAEKVEQDQNLKPVSHTGSAARDRFGASTGARQELFGCDCRRRWACPGAAGSRRNDHSL